MKECTLTPEEIIAKIKDAGIVGMGGACFPTHVKLMPPPGNVANILIINAVECEPYLTADHELMMEKPEQIMVGVSILMKAIKVSKAVIGIENNKPDAIQLMAKVASAYPGIEVMPLKVKYPQGGEKQLIDAVISRQVASGALPISTGAVVQNVGTAYAVYEAVQKNKPLFERVVTVTGSHEHAYRGSGRHAGGYRENHRRRPYDGKGIGECRCACLQRQFRRFADERQGSRARRDATVHPLRKVRQRLPDGVGALLAGNIVGAC